MKLAILGSSPIALEAAVRFHLHGASFTWFNFDEIEYEALMGLGPYTSESGLQMLKEMGKDYVSPKNFDYKFWKDHYYTVLADTLKAEHRLRAHPVASVAKRYLAPFEVPKGTTRFLDLFRVIFQVNPQEFIKEQEQNNPETFERLSKEMVDSLQTNIEMYEDFDLVLDLRRSVDPRSLSVTGRALGEGRVSRDQLKYGFEALTLAKDINQNAQDMRELALVGSSHLAAEMVIALEDWLKDERSRLFVISHEASPFDKFLEEGESSSVKKLKTIFEFMENDFQKEVNEFHTKLREWQELDDFVQVKKTKPVEPIPRLVFFSGHNASAVDQLIDKRRLFLTLEKPQFREGFKQPENNPLELKTIGADRILVANELNKPKLDLFLDTNELGFFSVDVSLSNMNEAWAKDLEKLKGVENEIFKLFSPAGTH